MPCCLFYSHLAFQRDPKPFKRFIAFSVSSRKKSKSYIYSILKSLLLEASPVPELSFLPAPYRG